MTAITKDEYADRIVVALRNRANAFADVTTDDVNRAAADGKTVTGSVSTIDPVVYLTDEEVKGAHVTDMCASLLILYSRMRKIAFREQADVGYVNDYTRYGVTDGSVDDAISAAPTGTYNTLMQGEEINLAAFDAILVDLQSVLDTNIDRVAYTVTFCHSSCHSNCHASRGRR